MCSSSFFFWVCPKPCLGVKFRRVALFLSVSLIACYEMCTVFAFHPLVQLFWIVPLKLCSICSWKQAIFANVFHPMLYFTTFSPKQNHEPRHSRRCHVLATCSCACRIRMAIMSQNSSSLMAILFMSSACLEGETQRAKGRLAIKSPPKTNIFCARVCYEIDFTFPHPSWRIGCSWRTIEMVWPRISFYNCGLGKSEER